MEKPNMPSIADLKKEFDVDVEASKARFHKYYEASTLANGKPPTPEDIWLHGSADMAMCVLVNAMLKSEE